MVVTLTTMICYHYRTVKGGDFAAARRGS